LQEIKIEEKESCTGRIGAFREGFSKFKVENDNGQAKIN